MQWGWDNFVKIKNSVRMYYHCFLIFFQSHAKINVTIILVFCKWEIWGLERIFVNCLILFIWKGETEGGKNREKKKTREKNRDLVHFPNDAKSGSGPNQSQEWEIQFKSPICVAGMQLLVLPHSCILGGSWNLEQRQDSKPGSLIWD